MISSHIIYVPLVLFLGIIIGFLLARQQGGAEQSEALRRLQARAARKTQVEDDQSDGQEGSTTPATQGRESNS